MSQGQNRGNDEFGATGTKVERRLTLQSTTIVNEMSDQGLSVPVEQGKKFPTPPSESDHNDE